MKRTVVIGASPNPERYSYKAVLELDKHGYEVFPVGIREGKIGQIDIITDQPKIASVDTVTLYVGPDKQPLLYDYIINLKPKRIIFNPGAENPELAKLANENGIIVEHACTLVLLRTKQYDQPNNFTSHVS